jgi:hypothetical protein
MARTGGDPVAAAANFRKIQESYQVLTDEKAKATYDALQEAKRQREAKMQEMDKKRKAGIDVLEQREKAARRRTEDVSGLEANYEMELARIIEKNKRFLMEMEARRHTENERKANALLFATENKYVPPHSRTLQQNWEQVARRCLHGHWFPGSNDGRAAEAEREAESTREKTRTLTLKWAKKGALDEAALRNAFAEYGEIDRLVAGKKSGILIFCGNAAAANAVHAVRTGAHTLVASAGLSVEWAGGVEDGAGAERPAEPAKASEGDGASKSPSEEASSGRNSAAAAAVMFAAISGTSAGTSGTTRGGSGSPMPSFSSWAPPNEGGAPVEGSILQHRDYESITMMRMRQMAERQRLAAEMDAADAAETWCCASMDASQEKMGVESRQVKPSQQATLMRSFAHRQ